MSHIGRRRHHLTLVLIRRRVAIGEEIFIGVRADGSIEKSPSLLLKHFRSVTRFKRSQLVFKSLNSALSIT